MQLSKWSGRLLMWHATIHQNVSSPKRFSRAKSFVLGFLVFFPFIPLYRFVPLQSSSPLPFFFFFSLFLSFFLLFFIWSFFLCLSFLFPPFSRSSLFFFQFYDSNWFFSLVRIGLDLKVRNAWDIKIILIGKLQYFPKFLQFPLFKRKRHFYC